MIAKSCSLHFLASPLQDTFFDTVSVYISISQFTEHFLLKWYILQLLPTDCSILPFLISFHSNNSAHSASLAYRRTIAGTTPATASYIKKEYDELTCFLNKGLHTTDAQLKINLIWEARNQSMYNGFFKNKN